MLDRRFQSASVLLYDPQATMRHNTRVALLGIGFGDVEAVSSIKEFREKAEKGTYDLVIGDTKGPEGAVRDMVRNIRQSALGQNPFVNVIMTLWDTSPDIVHESIQAGVDDLIGRPMSTKQIAERVGSLVVARKPFVVTEDYVGPERRNVQRMQHLPGNLMIVPNSLKAKVENRPELDATPENVSAALQAINDRKITIYTERFVSLGNKIMSLQGSLQDLETRQQLVMRMIDMNEDLQVRITGTEFEHLLSLSDALAKLLQRVAGAVGELSAQDSELLYQLPFALHKACQQLRMSTEMMFDIQDLSQKINKAGS